MPFFDQLFSQGARPEPDGGGAQGGTGSAFSPSGAGGLPPQLMALLASMQNRGAGLPAGGVGGANPGMGPAPQMPMPQGMPGGGMGGGGANPLMAMLAARGQTGGMPGGATAMPSGGGGGLLQMLMANPQLLQMLKGSFGAGGGTGGVVPGGISPLGGYQGVASPFGGGPAAT